MFRDLCEISLVRVVREMAMGVWIGEETKVTDCEENGAREAVGAGEYEGIGEEASDGMRKFGGEADGQSWNGGG